MIVIMHRLLLGVLVLIWLTLGSNRTFAAEESCPSSSNVVPVIPVQPRGSVRTYPVGVTVNRIRFVIPRNYFDYPPRGCNTEQPAFLLRALLPDFVGSSAETDREFRHVGGGLGRVVSILVKNVIQSRTANHEPDLEGFLHIWSYGSEIKWSGDGLYNLETGSYRSSVLKWDVYVQREGNAVTHVMRCVSADSARFPDCESVLFFKGTQVVYFFDRARLAEWKMIRDGIVTLLGRFARDEAGN